MDSCISYDTTDMLAGAGATHRSHLYPLAHESLQDAFSLR